MTIFAYFVYYININKWILLHNCVLLNTNFYYHEYVIHYRTNWIRYVPDLNLILDRCLLLKRRKMAFWMTFVKDKNDNDLTTTEIYTKLGQWIEGPGLNDTYLPKTERSIVQFKSIPCESAILGGVTNDNTFRDDIVIFNFEPNGSKVRFQGIVMSRRAIPKICVSGIWKCNWVTGWTAPPYLMIFQREVCCRWLWNFEKSSNMVFPCWICVQPISLGWVFGYFTYQLQGIERAVLISALTLYGSGPVQRYYLLSSFFLSDDKKQRSPTSDFSLKEFLKNEHNYLFVLETA